MSLTAIVNLAERLLNNSSGRAVESDSTSKQAKPATHVKPESNTGDKFTPSAKSQQDAGLFQVRQSNFFSAAADFLLAQTPPSQTNAAPAPPATQPAAAPPQNPPQTIAANPIVAAQFSAVNTAPTTAAPDATASKAAAPAAATAATPANSTQSQLLALNSALYALGLNNAQLAQIDQIASLIQVFNPVAFTSLVYQLEALAQASSQQVAAPLASGSATGTPAAPNNANSPVAGTSTPSAASGNSSSTNGGFQIQELVIKFSGIQESLAQASGGTQGSNTSAQLSAFNFQVEEVNLTLANQAGQSLQVTAPQSTAAVRSSTSAAVVALGKSAGA